MSIFSFLKDVGQKLLHGDSHDTAKGTNDNGQQLAQKLQEQLEKLNLGINAPKVTVEGDKAIIEGTADSQSALEKAILALGNTTGIAQVESKIQSPQAKTPKFYTVKSGDTLSKIAKEQYGNANRYQEIFEANTPMLKSADAIYPGQQLRIPQEEKAAA